MTRLRQSLEAGFRHPLLGPLLLLCLALLLVLVVFHTVEHGIEGLLFSCAILVAVAARLVVVVGRVSPKRLDQLPPAGRGPPRMTATASPAVHRQPALVALPLRR